MYQWLLALHIIAVISWMAGMLYLPRLFVYHCEADAGSRQSETFKVMERRLLRLIINPAMIATWVLGLWLAWQGGWFAAPDCGSLAGEHPATSADASPRTSIDLVMLNLTFFRTTACRGRKRSRAGL